MVCKLQATQQREARSLSFNLPRMELKEYARNRYFIERKREA
jgi:hypothetical protein